MNIPTFLNLLSSMAADRPSAIPRTGSLPGAEPPGHRVLAKLKRAADRLGRRRRRLKDRCRIDSFSDHVLRDMGLSREWVGTP